MKNTSKKEDVNDKDDKQSLISVDLPFEKKKKE